MTRPSGAPAARGPGRAIALLAALAALPHGAAAGEILPGPVPARIVAVIDGDTLAVRARVWLGQDVEIRVRIAGIDTPEPRGGCPAERRLAAAARAFVAARAVGRTVTLSDIRYGKYAGRVVARVVTADGEDLAAALIAAGLARPYAGRRRMAWCDGPGAG